MMFEQFQDTCADFFDGYVRFKEEPKGVFHFYGDYVTVLFENNLFTVKLHGGKSGKGGTLQEAYKNAGGY